MVNQTTNIVDNICIWDGDINSWQPPQGYLMLAEATTPTLIWAIKDDRSGWYLKEQLGGGDLGFTWNGSVLTTGQPMPPPPNPLPTT